MADGLDTGVRPHRRLSLWVAVDNDQAVLELSQDEWRAILSGEQVSRAGRGYSYEGEAFQDEWRFNLDGPLTLRIDYDDGGSVFAGDITEVSIERYDADSGDFTDQPELCLQFSSIDGLNVDIFEWAGLKLPDRLQDEASDRLWERYNPSSLFDALRSAIVEDIYSSDGGAPGTNDVRTQVWSMDCLLLKAELRRLLEAFLGSAK